MSKLSGWLKGMLGLLVVVALALVLAWLFRAAGQEPATGQAVSPTSTLSFGKVTTPTAPPLTQEMTPTATLSPTKKVTPTAILESQGTVRILYAVQPLRGAVTLWTLDLTPNGKVAAERELTASPIPVEGLRLYEVSISPDDRYVALNLRGGAEDLDFEGWIVEFASGQITQLPGLHQHGLVLLDWIPGTNRILATGMDGTFASTMDPNGSDVQELPLPYHKFQGGAVSPDGQRFVLSSMIESAFWLIDADGTLVDEVPIPDKGAGGAPFGMAWSPSGEWLAYADQLANEMSQIRTVDADFRQSKYLSSEDAHNILPVWSADGSTLVYIRENTRGIIQWDGGDPTAWNSSLWIADVETEQYRELVTSEGKACWSPAWLPDGSAIAFISNRAGQSDIWLVNRDGSGLRQLTGQGNVVALTVHR